MKISSTNLIVLTLVFSALLGLLYITITPPNPAVAPKISSTEQNETTQKQSSTPKCDNDACGQCLEGQEQSMDLP